MEAKNDFICLNCKFTLKEEDYFCSVCGQRTKLGRLTIKEILSDFFSSVFNLDAPFPKTLYKMFAQPDIVVKDFIYGKRKAYYAPVKYMVLCLFANILIGELIGFDPIENQRAIDSRELDEQSKIAYNAGAFLNKNLNYFLFLLPFSLAVFSKLFFWKSRYNFAERSAFGFYIAGQFIVISLIPIFLTKIHPAFMYMMYPLSISYFVFSTYKFFDSSHKLLKLILSFMTSILSFIGYIAVAYIVAYIIVTNQLNSF